MIETLLASQTGKTLATAALSMMPVIELRGGIPFGLALGLDYATVILAAIIGNLIPVPFIIIYIRKIFRWLRGHHHKLDDIVNKLEQKAHLKGRLVHKYQAIGLCLLVAIPLPGTGAWTGSLVAALLDIRLKDAIPAIVLGVVIAAAIVSAVSLGAIHTFGL